MAICITYTCDKCKKEMSSSGDSVYFRINRYGYFVTPSSYKQLQLCKKCSKALQEWLEWSI